MDDCCLKVTFVDSIINLLRNWNMFTILQNIACRTLNQNQFYIFMERNFAIFRGIFELQSIMRICNVISIHQTCRK